MPPKFLFYIIWHRTPNRTWLFSVINFISLRAHDFMHHAEGSAVAAAWVSDSSIRHPLYWLIPPRRFVTSHYLLLADEACFQNATCTTDYIAADFMRTIPLPRLPSTTNTIIIYHHHIITMVEVQWQSRDATGLYLSDEMVQFNAAFHHKSLLRHFYFITQIQ